MGARENECQTHKITSFTWNFQRFTCVFTILVKFHIIFSHSHEKFSLVLLEMTNYIFRRLKKCKKECNILVQGFCPLRIKITQFPGGFRLKCLQIHNIPAVYLIVKGVNLILQVDTIFHLLRKKWALIFEIFGSHFEIITKQCRSEVSRKKELFYALKTKQK